MVKINEILNDQRSYHKLDSNQHLWEMNTIPANFLFFESRLCRFTGMRDEKVGSASFYIKVPFEKESNGART